VATIAQGKLAYQDSSVKVEEMGSPEHRKGPL